MPSEKILAQKKAMVKSLSKELGEAVAGVLADYTGTNAEQDTFLRKKMREANVIYRVIKNTILERAFESVGITGLDDAFKGATVVAYSKTSYCDAAKILCDFAKDNEFYKIKAGFAQGCAVTAEQVRALAKLPPKETLVAQILYGFKSPIMGFATALSALPRSLVIALDQITKKKAA
jgi:large subunit ribosomal protein L10